MERFCLKESRLNAQICKILSTPVAVRGADNLELVAEFHWYCDAIVFGFP